jgi:hypothetical protein
VVTPVAERILANLETPEALESLYHEAPEAFGKALEEALATAPDVMSLRVWQARLAYREPAGDAWSGHRIWKSAAIGLAAGLLARMPAVWLGEDWYYPRFAPLIVIMSLALYFLATSSTRKLKFVGGGVVLGAASYVSLLPDYTDSVVMALIHLPLALWAYLGMSFLGDTWRDSSSRAHFVRYNGELVVLYSLFALGGMVLSAITIGLFALIDQDIGEWYFSNVIVICAAGVPVAATYVYDAVFLRRTAIASMLARIFAPLFLVMVVTYLGFTLYGEKNPFLDREFLITFNGLLVVVLGISVFSVVARDKESKSGFMDYVNIALITVTLLINTIALSAILYRLASFGFTPNRVVVLGANVLFFVHLTWMGMTYVSLVRQKSGFAAMVRVVGLYLPVYAAWALIVAFLLPIVFWFE